MHDSLLISIPSVRMVRAPESGFRQKSRAPALVAGWAPRISQAPGFGARLSYSAMRPRHILASIHHKTFLMQDERFASRLGAIIRIFNVFLMSFLYSPC